MVGAAKASLAALALAIALAAPASAGAAEATGNTTLVLAAGAKEQLDKRGIRLAGVRGPVTEGRRTRLQVSGGWVDSLGAVLNHKGALRIVAGKGRKRRVVRLAALQTRLGGNSVIRGKIDGRGRKPRVLFQLVARPEQQALDGLRGTASLRGARLIWPRAAARAISRRLGATVPQGEVGTARTGAVARAAGTPISGPLGSEPLLLARPASAVDVSGASLTWHVRDSWIRYLSSSTAPAAQEGATAKPAYPGNEHPCPDNPVATNPTLAYSYDFPFANGWYDPPSGTTALYYGGGVRFAYPSRGIDLATRNPEIEIGGPASRAIFRLKGAGGTAYPDSRAAIVSLAAGTPPVEGPAGTFTYAAPVKAALTADGEAVFGGFYSPPNNGFGCFSVSFSTG